jgi:hypothetical protein
MMKSGAVKRDTIDEIIECTVNEGSVEDLFKAHLVS